MKSKKFFVLLSVLVMGVLVLTACAGAGGQDQGQGTQFPGFEETDGAAIPDTGGEDAFPTDEFETSIPDTGAIGTDTGMSTPIGTSTPLATSTRQASSTDVVGGGLGTGTPMTSGTQSGGGIGMGTSTPVTGGIGMGTSTPIVSGTQVGGGIPDTGDGTLVQLSELLRYRVVDSEGNDLGQVSEYVINMCEAHIVYIALNPNGQGAGSGQSTSPTGAAVIGTPQVGSPTGSPASGGQQVLIPYEAVNLRDNPQGSGQDTLVVELNGADIASAPTVDVKTLDLNDTSWETEITGFWSQYMDLGLTTECRVPSGGGASGTAVPGMSGTSAPGATSGGGITSFDSTPAVNGTQSAVGTLPAVGTSVSGGNRVSVYKIALASAVLNADLQEGNGTSVGKISDAVIIPETGGILYFLAQATAGNQSAGAGGQNIALPPGAVNVRHEGSGASSKTILVLLVQTDVFRNAPGYTAGSGQLDSDLFDYWSQYIPMTQEALP